LTKLTDNQILGGRILRIVGEYSAPDVRKIEEYILSKTI